WDGSIVPVHVSLSLLETTHSQHLCAIVTDLTEQKRNQELIASQAFERATHAAAETVRCRVINVLEGIADSFFAVDGEWRITYINQGAAAMVGKGREELIGTVLWDCGLPGFEREMYSQYDKSMRERVPVHFEAPAAVSGVPDEHRWFERHVYPT